MKEKALEKAFKDVEPSKTKPVVKPTVKPAKAVKPPEPVKEPVKVEPVVEPVIEPVVSEVVEPKKLETEKFEKIIKELRGEIETIKKQRDLGGTVKWFILSIIPALNLIWLWKVSRLLAKEET